jgi:uncharacterized membrane protein
MLPEKLLHHDPVDGFRWRSHEVSRIEGFSDAVFGFAVTLLIVSLEVPKTSTELLDTMRGFGSFFATFVILAGMWYAQFSFFRRYGLEDRKTMLLNLVLLFTVLFFVYPLKFLFASLFRDPRLRGMVTTPHGLERIILPEHKPVIFAIFGTGFIAIFTVFLLLYRHAYAQRERLGLNEFEIFETRHTIRRMTMSIFVGFMYFVLAGLQALPSRTAEQRTLADRASLVVVAVFAIFGFLMFRLIRERSRVRREWLGKAANPSDLPPAPPGHSERSEESGRSTGR